ncbi:InlB B-repeat-containing protein [Pseudobutyrivibrio ruminis]|uniref:Listeria/Bacterioides repeat-containing protein n=1 Tax=Pseudobutyrivibrio ruminis DSM 9787 TaxID=1123011 RepID=A0A285S8S5_9FIRM|nr:InlB B-repeat-containing protein [Pseudobutyrivibrio ruminis]SOC03998.1 Listeria/Bacterioides repeat-containing protein [Pseudobutyrivibrio ruminis DSM 9787]
MKKTRRFLALLLAVFMLVTSFQYNDLKVYAEEAPVVEENIEEPSVEEIPQEEPETPVQQEIPPVAEGSEEIINEEQPGVVEETPAEDSMEEELQAEEQEEEQEIVNDAEFILTVDANGGKFYNEETTLTLTEVTSWVQEPIREGYYFAGWYLDKECKQPCYGWSLNMLEYDYNKDMQIAIIEKYNGKTIYARWAEKQCTITYHFGKEGGTDSLKDKGYYTNYNNESMLEYTVEVPAGVELNNQYAPQDYYVCNSDYHYAFSGKYYTDYNRTKEYKLGSKVSSDLELYVGYEKCRIVTFHTCGGTLVNEYNRQLFRDDDLNYVGQIGKTNALNLDGMTATKEGFNFGGWYTDEAYKSAAERYYSECQSDLDLYAKWEKNCTVTFDLGNGTAVAGDNYSFTVVEGTSIAASGLSVPSNPIAKDSNQAFDGWYADENFTQKVERSDIANATVNEDITYYAKYSAAYTVTYDVNGGSFIGQSGTTYSVKVPKGEKIGGRYPNVESNEDKKTFAGWYIDDKEVTNIPEYVVTKDITLKAKYDECFTITFHTNQDGVKFSENNSDTFIVKVPKGEAYRYSQEASENASIFNAPTLDIKEVNGKRPLVHQNTSTSILAYSTASDGSENHYYFNDKYHVIRTVDSNYKYEQQISDTGFVPTSDIDLYVVWGDVIEVTYDGNGKTFEDISHGNTNIVTDNVSLIDDNKKVVVRTAKGTSLNDLIVGKRIANYSDSEYYRNVIGWYKTSDYKNYVNEKEPLIENTTVYAKWQGGKVTKIESAAGSKIVFDAGAGYIEEANRRTFETYYDNRYGDVAVACPIPMINDPNKAFIGWYTDEACTKPYKASIEYYVYKPSLEGYLLVGENSGVSYVSITSEIKRLYAGYGPANHVKLDANGGYFDADISRVNNPTEAQKSEMLLYVKEDYKGHGICISEYTARVRRDGNKVFAGWYLDKECTQKAVTEAKQVNREFYTPKSSEVTLYAKWEDYKATSLSHNNPSTMTLKIGQKYKLNLNVTPNDGNVRWVIDEGYSNNTTLDTAVKISNDGTVTALAAGRAVVHAECNGARTSDISINVSNATVGTSITLDKSETNLFSGESTTVTALVTPESSASNVKWTTSDKDIVAVEGFGDTATLTAGTKEGTAKVTATIGKVKSEITVNVTKPIELDKKECTLTSMENVSVTLNTKLADSLKAQKKEITWTISDETALSNTSLHATGFYATNAQFTVTPDLEETKVVTVTASITDGDKTYSDSCVITINPQLKTASPVASIPSGTAVKKGTKISLASDTYQSDIYYTVDGKDPIKWDKELYMDPIVINEDTTIKAFAVKSKRKDSEIVEFHYTIDTADWGDIKDDETKALFANDSSKVPSGMWYLVGDKSAYYTENDVIDFAKTYTGNAITFNDDICVYQGTTKLVENKDYTVSYKNNKLAAKNDDAKAPTVNIKGKGNYKNTVNFMFNINPASLSEASIASDKVVEIKSGSKTKLSSVKPTIMFAGKKLAEGKDYELLYYGYTSDNEVSENERIDAPSKEIVKEADQKYAVVAIAKDGGNYVGAVPGMVVAECYDKNTEVAVSGLKVVDAKGKALSVEYTGAAYSVQTLFDNSNGNEVKAFVKDGKKVLEYNKDFIVDQVPNDEYASAGVHTIRVVGQGHYVGEKEFTFTITGKQLNKVKVAGLSTSVEYTGSAITLNDLFNKNDKTLDDKWTGVTLYEVDAATKEKVALEEGKHYTVSMENTGKVGKFTLKFTGINGYTGAIVKTIKVTSFNIKIDDGNLIYVNIADSKFTTQYTKSGAKPSVEVTFDGTVLKEGVDYTIAYKNNKAIVENENALLALPASKRPTVNVTGKGNFAGSINRCFCITKTDISNAELVLKDVNYNEKGKKGYFLATPTITENGQKLAVGKNKDVEAIAKTDYIYTFAEDTWYDSVRCVYAGTKITADTEVPEGALIKVSVVVKCSEKSPYSSASNGTELVGYYRVIEKSKDLSQSKFKATLKNPSKFVYDDGNEVIPLKSEDILVYYMEGKEKVEVSPNEYEIVSVTNNTKIGKATVVIRGKHSIFGYGGIKTITFNIGAKSL